MVLVVPCRASLHLCLLDQCFDDDDADGLRLTSHPQTAADEAVKQAIIESLEQARSTKPDRKFTYEVSKRLPYKFSFAGVSTIPLPGPLDIINTMAA